MIYVHAFLSWCGCRIFLFVWVCIVAGIHALMNVNLTEFESSVLYFPYCFMVFMMCGLEVLHIFWTYYIAESFISVKVSSKMARHSYD